MKISGYFRPQNQFRISNETKAMRNMKIPARFVPLFLWMFLRVALVATQALPANAQAAPAAGTSVAVKMVDAVNSANDPGGQQYRASVTKAVNAGDGVTIPQGAAATVILAYNGSGLVAQLASVTINGQPVAVASSSASLTSAAQNVAGNAANKLNSVLGGFGLHVDAPAPATAVVTGQRVILPPGTTLIFVLSEPPAAPASETASAMPVAQPMQASTAPVAAPGQNWWMCQYRDLKDISKPALGNLRYWALLPSNAAVPNGLNAHFNGFVQQNYKINDPGKAGGYCRRYSNDAAGREFSKNMLLKQWTSSNDEPIQVSWTDTPAQDAAIDARLAGAASDAAAAASHAGGPFISCSTSGGAGNVIYVTGIFQTTKPVRQLPNGARIVDQSILNDFYAYLTQNGHSFKPGSDEGCDVSPTETAAKAAQHTRIYGGAGSCGYCGNKVVETGWKE